MHHIRILAGRNIGEFQGPIGLDNGYVWEKRSQPGSRMADQD